VSGNTPRTWRRPLQANLAALALLLVVVLVCVWAPPAWGDGAELFAQHCAGCHLHGGNIIRRGKTLKLAALARNGINNPAAIAQIAAEGIGQMDGYATVLGEGGPEAVAAWVWDQAQNAWIQG
jgi:cytochrome c6